MVKKNWVRNYILISILFSFIYGFSAFVEEYHANTCKEYFCGLDGLLYIPIGLVLASILTIILIKKYVTEDWKIIGISLLGTIVTVLPILYTLSGFFSKTFNLIDKYSYTYSSVIILTISSILILSLSLIFYTWLWIKYRFKVFIVIPLVFIVTMFLNSFLGLIENRYINPKLVAIVQTNSNNSQKKLNNDNSKKISESGIVPYKPTYYLPGWKLSLPSYSNSSPMYFKLMYDSSLNSVGLYDIYEFKNSNKITTSNCGIFDPSLLVGYDIPYHPCVPVGTYNGNTIYYSSIDAISTHPASSAYYVQIGNEVITLSDYLYGILDRENSIKIIESLQQVSPSAFISR